MDGLEVPLRGGVSDMANSDILICSLDALISSDGDTYSAGGIVGVGVWQDPSL